jgi:hypothetical protein
VFNGGFTRGVKLVTNIFSLLPVPMFENSRLQAALFLDSYRRINVEFQREDGENLPMARFFGKTPISVCHSFLNLSYPHTFSF